MNLLAQANDLSSSSDAFSTFAGLVGIAGIILLLILAIMWIMIPVYLSQQLKVQRQILGSLSRIESMVAAHHVAGPASVSPPEASVAQHSEKRTVMLTCPTCAHEVGAFIAPGGWVQCPRCGEQLRG